MIKIKKGSLIIAKPTIINDDIFNRSVILLSEHNKNESVGFILNKKKIYYWSPFLTEVATIKAVINSAYSMKRYFKEYDTTIIDAAGKRAWSNPVWR